MNRLKPEKQVLAISMLADGASLRSTERVTGVHRNILCRHLVSVGERCQRIMDNRFRELEFNALEIDEIWGYVGKKERHLRPGDPGEFGDQYCFIAQCPESKLIPCFELGKRTHETTQRFIENLAVRVNRAVQLSTDGFAGYRTAIADHFGPDADYMMIVKKFASEGTPQHPYNPPQCIGMDRVWVQGFPELRWSCTSHIEAQNVGLRTAVRRMARLTLCFSKKWENLLAALRLHFCVFNFVRKHGTLGTTPAVAAGLESEKWSIQRLLAV